MGALRRPVDDPPSHLTVEEFLLWAEASPDARYELVDGEPRAMAPTINRHGIVQGTMHYLITRHLIDTGSPCVAVVAPGVQPRARADINFRIPDLGVSCAAEDLTSRTLAAPVLLVEVLSPSTERDTWANVWAYTTIPSVREILVLKLAHVAAELLRRQPDGSWPAETERLGAQDTLVLDSIGLSLPLAEVYARTDIALPR